MQIILCSRRRSASGKRAIWRARPGWFKKASYLRPFPEVAITPYRSDCRSRNPAELLHQPQLVGLVPVLYDSPAFDPPNRHPGHPDLFARSRNAEEVSFVRPVRGNPSRNLVPLRNEVFDHVIPRGTVDEHFERLFPSLPRRWDAWERVVFHEVGCKKLIENVGVALLAGLINRLKQPSYQCLVLLGAHPTPRQRHERQRIERLP